MSDQARPSNPPSIVMTSLSCYPRPDQVSQIGRSARGWTTRGRAGRAPDVRHSRAALGRRRTGGQAQMPKHTHDVETGYFSTDTTGLIEAGDTDVVELGDGDETELRIAP